MPPRPEFENPPEIFYNAREARQYNVSTRIQNIQREMTLRALELMNLVITDASAVGPDGAPRNSSALLLDVGCGTGISGDVLTQRGHAWFGVDISLDMLRIAKHREIEYYLSDGSDGEDDDDADGRPMKRNRADPGYVRIGPIHESDEESEEDDDQPRINPDTGRLEGPRMIEVAHSDIGQGIPFRPGSFDGCVSISVIQWLCHTSKKGENPQRRLMAFFQSLYNALCRGAKAVLQFYPSAPEQVHMITKAAMKCGFNGGVVVDYPHSTKAKKYYLVLQAGQVAGGFTPPPGLSGEPEAVDNSDEEDEEDDDEDDADAGRTRARVAGRDRERVKRHRAGSSRRNRRKDNRPATGSKDWVLMKKEERRRRGYDATEDTKYTMRQRKPRF